MICFNGEKRNRRNESCQKYDRAQQYNRKQRNIRKGQTKQKTKEQLKEKMHVPYVHRTYVPNSAVTRPCYALTTRKRNQGPGI